MSACPHCGNKMLTDTLCTICTALPDEPATRRVMDSVHMRTALSSVCDICHKRRGRVGTRNVSHVKCSKIRQSRGFKNE